MREVEIKDYDITNLERAYYDYTSYLNLLSYVLNNNLASENENFISLLEKYKIATKEYLREKEKFQLEYVNKIKENTDNGWELIFFNKTIIFK